MKSALNITQFLLNRRNQNFIGSITPLKLQKLLYYAQAWSLVFRDQTLFDEDIEAWVHGPVVPNVYARYKQYRYNSLPQEKQNNFISTEEAEILLTVLKAYGAMSGKSLEHLTHSEYPWVKARAGLRIDQKSQRKILIQDMKRYYSRFVESYNPPEIHSTALKATKDCSKRRSHDSLLIGMGSVLDIFPASSRRVYYSPSDFDSSLSDFESLTADWEKVGGYIQTSMDIVRQESTEHDR